ncbi:hypothetical protein V5O48_005263 [Marasmius crinis-equi]|uniref:Myb-like domain-containing protein n=1 Tax=Marasmius crinis-equi TaxID=585013 RepID=A0ABR3FMS3_9AGAR
MIRLQPGALVELGDAGDVAAEPRGQYQDPFQAPTPILRAYPSITVAWNMGKWSSREDTLLRQGYEAFGQVTFFIQHSLGVCLANTEGLISNSWSNVSGQFVLTRNPVQCSRRWRRCVNPSLNLSKWTSREDRQILELINETDGNVYGMDWKKLGSEYFPGRRRDRLERRAIRLIKDIAKGRRRNVAPCVGRRSTTESDSSSTASPVVGSEDDMDDGASSHTTSDRSAECSAGSQLRVGAVPHDQASAASIQDDDASDQVTDPPQDLSMSNDAHYGYDSFPPRQNTMSVQRNDASDHASITRQGMAMHNNPYYDYDSVCPWQDMMSVQNNDAYGHTAIPHQDRAMTNDACYDHDSIPPRQDTMSAQDNDAYSHITIPRQDVELSNNAYCDYRSIPPRQDAVDSQSDAAHANYTPVPRRQGPCAGVQDNEPYDYPLTSRQQHTGDIQSSDTRGISNAQGGSSNWRLMQRPTGGDRSEERMSFFSFICAGGRLMIL